MAMETNYRGIDYGMGTTNIDPNNGIRYGVIPAHAVGQAWYDDAEPDYGPPTCPKCGSEDISSFDLDTAREERLAELDDAQHDAIQEELAEEFEWYDESCEYHCPSCCYSFDSEEAYGDEPLAFYVDDGEYQAHQGGDDSDIFITRSPYYTRAQFCSPCAPGAGYLLNECPTGEKAYCFGHDWFEGDIAPYTVYRVVDDTVVNPPTRETEDQRRERLREELAGDSSNDNGTNEPYTD